MKKALVGGLSGDLAVYLVAALGVDAESSAGSTTAARKAPFEHIERSGIAYLRYFRGQYGSRFLFGEIVAVDPERTCMHVHGAMVII